ncbi:DUF1302 domain-containing protein [Balneatrix alpica]|uniref:DUF1302 domain-containing protein n=1 Tax=Balneatrix alpica TaxID=75684 RepID=A0ABV5ZCZ3_9GAMM|nr:DUF1302 domain-containing protein [Balneatrix alpica]
MATKITRLSAGTPSFSPRPLALAVAGITAVLTAGQTQAIEFNLGEVQGTFNSNISVGASWRTENADPYLISKANGGTGPGAGNDDDGNLNFHKGETFSKIIKGVHDLDLRYNNIGGFVRAKYWYDFELKDGPRSHGHTGNGYAKDKSLDDAKFDDFSKFSGFEFLDAFVYGNFDLGGRPLDARLGRQVVSWGEGTFLQGGINTVNPVDANTFRRPGAEVKEGLLPVNMLYGNLGLTSNLSAEAFYQLEFSPTVVDGCGTYFSDNDYGAEGCNGIRVYNGSTVISGNPILNPAYGTLGQGDEAYFKSNFVVKRDSNGVREADDHGQYGLGLRYFAEELNGTEFGLFYTNLHSRVPVVSAVKTTSNPATTAFSTPLNTIINLPTSFGGFGGLSNFQAALAGGNSTARSLYGLHTLDQASKSTYFTEYTEDIQTLGLSFNTTVGEVALSGEISHKRDVPMQVNGTALLTAIATLGNSGHAALDQRVQSTPYGGIIKGYDQFDVTQAQVTAVKTFDRVLGASQLAVAGEVGMIHVHGLDESPNAIKYGRSSAFGYTPGDNDGFVTQNSWGYAVRASLSYPDAVAGINLTPTISFKHDVEGVSPQPGGVFNEGSKSLGLSIGADYLNKYNANLSWNHFFDGKYNTLKDRDFVSASFGMTF